MKSSHCLFTLMLTIPLLIHAELDSNTRVSIVDASLRLDLISASGLDVKM